MHRATRREGGYAASADALLPALRLERAAFGRLAASHPFLLTVNPKVLADSLQEMGAALGLPPEQVTCFAVLTSPARLLVIYVAFAC